MKEFDIVLKVVAVLAAIAGIVIVIIAYGDKIAAWFNSLMIKLGWKQGEVYVVDEDIAAEEDAAPAEESAIEEAVHADDKDFEG